jgi:hypothetical protein
LVTPAVFLRVDRHFDFILMAARVIFETPGLSIHKQSIFILPDRRSANAAAF